MLPKKKRNKFGLIYIEQFFKKYQFFSIIIPIIISSIALYISIRSINLTESQIEKEKIPLWDYKILSDIESEARSIQFISLKPGFKIQNLEIITSEYIKTKETYKTGNEIWNLYEFQNSLLSLYSDIYKLPDIITNGLSTSYFKDNYPIIIKINYVYNNEILENTLLFKTSFNVYGIDKLKITSLTLIKQIDKFDKDNCAKYLDYIDKTEFMSKRKFAFSDELINNLFNVDTLVKQYLILIASGGSKCTQKIKYIDPDSTNSSFDYLEYDIPAFYCDSNIFNSFIKEKDSIKNNISKKNIIISKSIFRIDSFIKANPYKFSHSYNRVINNNWLNEKTFNSWEKLVEDEMINFWKYYNKEVKL